MRILYLCHRIPCPPNKGDKIRAFHQIRAMGAKHEVDVFTLADDSRDLVHQGELAKYCRRLTVARIHPRLARWRALPFLFTRVPMTLPYFYSAELRARVNQALRTQTYDRIFVYCSAMAQYVETVRGIPILLDLVDVDSDKWAQYADFSRFPFSSIYRREARRLQEYERKICEKAAHVMVTTEREAQLLCKISETAAIHVIPNGVDSDYFNPAVVLPRRTRPTIIFTGDMSYFPNQEAATHFARNVLPLVRKSVKTARFLIVGRKPGREVLRLTEIEGVEVTGFVPDIRECLARAHVAVAPFSIAAGIQNKILEAMAYGLPVVATPKAAQGLSSAVAELVRTGSSAEQWAGILSQLLNDRALAVRLGEECRRRVTVGYNWDQSIRCLLDLLEAEPMVEAASSTPLVSVPGAPGE